MDRHLKPLSSMMSPHRPARMIICSMLIIRLRPTFKKIQPQGIPVSYTQIGLKLHSWRKKSFLTTKPALVIQMDIVCVDGRFNMLGCI